MELKCYPQNYPQKFRYANLFEDISIYLQPSESAYLKDFQSMC